VAWAVWLSIPVVVTLLAAMWSWLRSRPAPSPTTNQSMQAHSEYLDALVQTARSKDRGRASHDDPPTDPHLSSDS
jgi:hypothetical protein